MKLIAGLLAVLTFAGVLPAGDDNPIQPSVSEEELQIYKLLKGKGPPGTIQKAARDILVNKPDSFVSLLALAGVNYNNGCYPRTLFLLKKARTVLEQIPGHTGLPLNGEPQWHALIIYRTAEALGAMDRREDELAILDEFERLGYGEPGRRNNFSSNISFRRIVALVKTGEVEEASSIAAEQLARPGMTEREKLYALMDKARVDFAADPGGEKAYKIYRDVYEREKQTKKKVPSVLLNTLAFHARRQGDYDETVRLLGDSTGIMHSDSASHPYNTLSGIYILQGKWPEAKNSIKECWEWARGKRGDIKQALSKDSKLTLAQFYLATGYPERALQIISPLLNKPKRTGFTYRRPEQWRSGLFLLHLSSSRQTRGLGNELSAGLGLAKGIFARLKQLPAIWREWLSRRRLRAEIASQLASDNDGGDAFSLVFCPPWMWGDVIQALGPTISARIFDECPLPGKQGELFTEAIQTEIAFAKGDLATVLDVVPRALSALPVEEKLWRARLCAIAGDSTLQTGDPSSALGWFQQALDLNPAVFRQLDLKLPVSGIESDGNEITSKCAELLAKSPHLSISDVGFRLTLNADNDKITWRLSGEGSAWGDSVEVKDDTPDDEIVTYATNNISRQIFSPLPLIKVRDYDRLEGRALRGRKERKGISSRIIKSNTGT